MSAPSRSAPDPAEPIVFFDGVCGLCDGFVRWLLAHDRRGALRVAPLQGEAARAVLGPPEGDPQGWTVILLADGERHERSDAVLETLRRMGHPWSLLAGLRVVPRPVRDGLYRFVARRRYRWFGQRAECRLPTRDEAARFLP